MCSYEGCIKPINKDGLCLLHKLRSVRANTAGLRTEREGRDVTGGQGTSAYVQKMYKDRRAAGMEDPEPVNKKSARFAPARGVIRG